MNQKEKFERLLDKFGHVIGIEPLTLNEENGCTLSFDELIVNIQYVEDDNSFLLFSDLGKIPESKNHKLYKELLTANFYRSQLINAAFSYCESTDSIVLILLHPIDSLVSGQLDEIFQKFIDLVDAWTMRFKQEQSKTKVPESKEANNEGQTGWLKI
ncbi:type III secretion system chaperone [bacterium]|nr:type III secretion system chaperone [bacterium]